MATAQLATALTNNDAAAVRSALSSLQASEGNAILTLTASLNDPALAIRLVGISSQDAALKALLEDESMAEIAGAIQRRLFEAAFAVRFLL